MKKFHTVKDSLQLIDHCLEKEIVKNIDFLKRSQGVESIDQLDSEKISWAIVAYMSKECDFYKKHYINPALPVFVKREKVVSGNCSDFFQGEFYALEKSVDGSMDTIIVVVDEDSYQELTNNRMNTTRLELEWVNECEFHLIFISSDDVMKDSFSEPGDVYKYHIMEISNDTMTIETLYEGKPYYYDLIRN